MVLSLPGKREKGQEGTGCREHLQIIVVIVVVVVLVLVVLLFARTMEHSITFAQFVFLGWREVNPLQFGRESPFEVLSMVEKGGHSNGNQHHFLYPQDCKFTPSQSPFSAPSPQRVGRSAGS